MGQSEKKKMDTALFVLVLILAVCGLLLLYSTSAYNGRVKFHDPAYYFKKQLFATALGILGMCMVSRMDYRALLRFAPVLYLASLGLSAAVLFVGEEINGSRRWLSLGPLSFQPSEFAKVAVILFLAWVIQKTRSRTTSFRFMALVIVSILPVAALVGSNNLSTAVIILAVGMITVFVSNPRYLPFLWIGAAAVCFVAVFLSVESYRLERLAIWRNPEAYEKGFPDYPGAVCHRQRRGFRKGPWKFAAEAGVCAGSPERYDLFHYL